MSVDRFDKILIVLAGVTILGLALHLGASEPEGKSVPVDSKVMERELASQARLALIDKLFSPVTTAMQAGQYQEALLKLEEVNVRYPGEAHGFILKGEILDRMGVTDQAAAAFVRGVKLNGDYIDRHNHLSRRPVIAKLVEANLPAAVDRYRGSPGNPAVREQLANLNYLKSRLAGGCE